MTVVDIGSRGYRGGGNGGKGGDGGDLRELWLKRQANLVVSQLPEDPDEAVRVLEWAHRIIRYLGGR